MGGATLPTVTWQSDSRQNPRGDEKAGDEGNRDDRQEKKTRGLFTCVEVERHRGTEEHICCGGVRIEEAYDVRCIGFQRHTHFRRLTWTTHRTTAASPDEALSRRCIQGYKQYPLSHVEPGQTSTALTSLFTFLRGRTRMDVERGLMRTHRQREAKAPPASDVK